jgi:hypothetical protein
VLAITYRRQSVGRPRHCADDVGETCTRGQLIGGHVEQPIKVRHQPMHNFTLIHRIRVLTSRVGVQQFLRSIDNSSEAQ